MNLSIFNDEAGVDGSGHSSDEEIGSPTFSDQNFVVEDEVVEPPRKRRRIIEDSDNGSESSSSSSSEEELICLRANLEGGVDLPELDPADEDPLMTHFNVLRDYWIPKEGTEGHKMTPVWAANMFRFDRVDEITMDELRKRFKSHAYQILTLKRDFMRQQRCVGEVEADFRRMLELCYYGNRLMVDMYRCQQALDRDRPLTDDPGLWRFTPMNPHDDLSPLQECCLFLLHTAYEKSYRRYCEGEEVFEQVRSPDGFETFAWKKKYNMMEFVHESIKKDLHFDQFRNLLTGNNMSSVIKFLKNTREREFPMLVRDRHIFSFSNGVYLAHEDKFFEYGTRELSNANFVSAVYHDLEMDPYLANTVVYETEESHSLAMDSVCAIPTPHFDKIMKDQAWDYEMQLWNWVFLGRLIYNLGERDDWQAMSYYLGLNNTGKSTFCKIVELFYDENDTGVISNNTEKTFGLSAFYDKFIVVGPELKKNFNIDQAEIQSMIANEAVSVKKKGVTAFKVKWRPPLIMAGNEVPEWDDAAGAMCRRIVIFPFKHTIRQTDSGLFKKISKELPRIILKANRIYRHFTSGGYQGRGIWNLLPQVFRDSRQSLQKKVSKIHEFMSSEKYVLHERAYIPVETVRTAYNKWRSENHYTRGHAWSKDAYLKVATDFGIAVRRTRLPYPPESSSFDPNEFSGSHDYNIRFFFIGLGSSDLEAQMGWNNLEPPEEPEQSAYDQLR